MSEGAASAVTGGSSNVTSGVAMRQPPLAPERPDKKRKKKDFESYIDATIKESAARKLSEVLTEAVVNVGDHVTAEGKKGRVVSKSPDHVGIDFEDGSHKSLQPGDVHVDKASPQLHLQARWHFDDARIARKQGQLGRYHESNAHGYDLQARQADWEGDKTGAENSRKAAAESRAQAKSHYKAASQTKPMVPNRPPKPLGNGMVWRHYYIVPFKDKDKAKAKGLKWDGDEKKWFLPSREAEHAEVWPDSPWKFSHTYNTSHRRRYGE